MSNYQYFVTHGSLNKIGNCTENYYATYIYCGLLKLNFVYFFFQKINEGIIMINFYPKFLGDNNVTTYTVIGENHFT